MISLKFNNDLPDENRIFIYGGSFNPVHCAHCLLVSYIHSLYPLTPILVLPSFNPPFQKTLIPFEHRLKMLKLATTDIPNITISDLEKQLQLPYSATIDIILELQKIYTNKHFTLIVGSDIPLQFHKWKQHEKLLQICDFFLVPRTGYPMTQNHPDNTLPMPQLSSTELRQLLAQKKYHECNLKIPANVLNYIKTHKLYCED